MKNLKDEIERIINGIGSQYGEGASYNRLASYDRERDGKLSHLEDYEIEELTKDITSLIEQENEQFLIRFKDYVFEQPMNVKLWHEYIEQYLAERKG